MALAAGCFASLMGFARLAYGTLVPAMRHSLGGTLGVYGLIGTLNLGGYLGGALLATALGRRADRARIDLGFLFATAALLAATAFVRDTFVLGGIRFAVGLTSGVALTLTLALATEPVASDRRGLAAAVIWAGGALGVALVGLAELAVPVADETAWRAEWVAMGVAGALLAAGFGWTVGAAFARTERRDDGAPIGLFARERYRALSIAYFCYGFGYIAVVTFLGAALSRSAGVPAGAVWSVLGLAGACGALVWGPLLDRLRSGVPVALAAAGTGAGALLIASGTGVLALAGAFVVGICFIGVPAMVGALVQQRQPPGSYPRAFAAITSTLGVGQIIGPAVGGRVADAAGPAGALDLGAAVLLLGALCALAYRRPAVAHADGPPGASAREREQAVERV